MNRPDIARHQIATTPKPHETDAPLDPENWLDFATVAHQALDNALNLLRREDCAPVSHPGPDNVNSEFPQQLSIDPVGVEHACAEINRLGDQVLKSCRQAQYLEQRIAESRWLELLAPVSLNIVCFRFRAPHLTESHLNAANAAIVLNLQEQGIPAPSTTTIDGKLAIRVNITNHRTREDDLDFLANAIVELGTDRLISGALPCLPDHQPAPHSPTVMPSQQMLPAPPGEVAQLCLSTIRLEKCMERPELRALGGETAFRIDDSLPGLFRIESPARVAMSPQCFETPAGAAVLIRHALELTLLGRIAVKPGECAWPGTAALLACRTAGTYLHGLPALERDACTNSLPQWLLDAYEGLRQDGSWSIPECAAAQFSTTLASLLEFQGIGAEDILAIAQCTATKSAPSAEFDAVGRLAAPTETLLVSGGDPRIQLDCQTGRNGYGSSSRPIDAEISFSSSTATTVSQAQYECVEALREKLIGAALAGHGQVTFEDEMESVRTQILEFTGAGKLAGAQAILASSGTDAALTALHFALPGGQAKLTSIIIAPNENGSGTVMAAGGRHFSSQSPLGHTVTAGEQIEGYSANSINVRTVLTRKADGTAKDPWEIDSGVELLVEQAIGTGSKSLLHVLDASKLGWGAPSLSLVKRLKARHGDKLDIVIDACQMRLGHHAIHAYLKRGYMVQITGSKFFAGPPFCGALLLPPAIAARDCAQQGIAHGMKAYATRTEWPVQMQSPRQSLTDRQNLGLLARWTAALTEINTYTQLPAAASKQTLARFAIETTRLIDASDHLIRIEAMPFDRTTLDIDDSRAAVPTIFAFTLHVPQEDGTKTILSLSQTKSVHKWLNLDLAAHLPGHATDTERYLAAKPCLIGQPVKLGEQSGTPFAALRICASARIVNEIHAQDHQQPSSMDHFDSVMADVRTCLDKIALILRHFDHLAEVNAIG